MSYRHADHDKFIRTLKGITKMAKVVLGMGTSHSPQLSTEPDQWSVHSERDKVNPQLWGVDGKVHTYEALVKAAGSTMASEITPGKFRDRYKTCQQRIAKLGTVLADVARADAPD